MQWRVTNHSLGSVEINSVILQAQWCRYCDSKYRIGCNL